MIIEEALNTWFDKKNVDKIVDLLIKFDSNKKTSDFNKFLKNRGYK